MFKIKLITIILFMSFEASATLGNSISDPIEEIKYKPAGNSMHLCLSIKKKEDICSKEVLTNDADGFSKKILDFNPIGVSGRSLRNGMSLEDIYKTLITKNCQIDSKGLESLTAKTKAAKGDAWEMMKNDYTLYDTNQCNGQGVFPVSVYRSRIDEYFYLPEADGLIKVCIISSKKKLCSEAVELSDSRLTAINETTPLGRNMDIRPKDQFKLEALYTAILASNCSFSEGGQTAINNSEIYAANLNSELQKYRTDIQNYDNRNCRRR